MGPFGDIVGHEREIDVLKSAVSSGRLAHAYLFCGPDGIGKRLVARAFASALNCLNPVNGWPCGACRDCSVERHPNVTEVNPTVKIKEDVFEDDEENGLIRVHQAREIQSSLRYRVERGKKTVIVNSADKFMPQAANAFLKTLEEPPPDSVIILITSRPSGLLPTVVSRCQRLSFRALAHSDVAKWLMRINGLSSADASVAARLGAGSVKMSLRYGAEGLYEKRKEAAEGLKKIGQGGALAALSLAESMHKRDDLEDVLEFFKTLCRDACVMIEGMEGVAVNPGMAEFLKHEGGEARLRRALIEAFSLIEKTRLEIMPPRNGNKQLALEALFLRLAEGGAFS